MEREALCEPGDGSTSMEDCVVPVPVSVPFEVLSVFLVLGNCVRGFSDSSEDELSESTSLECFRLTDFFLVLFDGFEVEESYDEFVVS